MSRPPDAALPGLPPEVAPPRRPGPPVGVDVWRIRLDRTAEVVRWATGLLDPSERQRAASARDPLAARRYVIAHGAARSVLSRYLGTEPGALRWSRGAHGKPGFTGARRRWQWNLSHSAGHALLAVSVVRPVGVDIERVRERTDALALALRFLPPEEAAEVASYGDPGAARTSYHRFLARKEACVKAVGGRILDGLRLEVRQPGPVHGGPGVFARQRWEMRDLPAPPGFVAALATEGSGGYPVRLFEWQLGPTARSAPCPVTAGLLPSETAAASPGRKYSINIADRSGKRWSNRTHISSYG